MVNTNQKFENLKIIIPTCDKYIHILEALMYTINKFWPIKNEFIILGYKSPDFELYSNWKFVSLGKDCGAQYWSNGIIEYFKNLYDDYFIFLADDVIMTRYADSKKIEDAFYYMVQNNSIKKAFLQGSLIHGGIEVFGNIEYSPIQDLHNNFYEVNQECNYRSSLQAAIWSKKYFLNCIKDNMSPWDFELQHIKNDGARILTTLNNHPLMFAHLCGQIQSPTGKEYFSDWNKSTYEDTWLPEEDVMEIKKILKI